MSANCNETVITLLSRFAFAGIATDYFPLLSGQICVRSGGTNAKVGL